MAREPMTKLTPRVQNLARLLLAQERAKLPIPAHAAESACRKMRTLLVELVGEEGVRVLLTRALVLANRDAPGLAAVQVNTDCVLEGLAEAGPGGDAEQAAEAFVILLAHVLGLLVTFIGESLTLRIVREMWPEAPLDDTSAILHQETEG